MKDLPSYTNFIGFQLTFENRYMIKIKVQKSKITYSVTMKS